MLVCFAQAVEKAQAPGGDLEATRPFASKAAEHAARIAVVLTLYDNPDAQEIAVDTMAQAIQLAKYCLGEALRLADAARISSDIADAERLRVWLTETWDEPHVSVPDLTQLGPRSIRTAERARKLAGKLEAEGWLISCEDGATIRGKRRRAAWRIHGRAGE